MKKLLTKSLPLLIVLTMLTGCSASNSDLTKVKPSGNLQVRCADLRAPKVGEGKEQYTGYVIDSFHKCAAKDDAILSGMDVMSYYSSSAYGDVLNQHKGNSSGLSLSGASQGR